MSRLTLNFPPRSIQNKTNGNHNSPEAQGGMDYTQLSYIIDDYHVLFITLTASSVQRTQNNTDRYVAITFSAAPR